jgi:superfamily II DNA/RNA helicase
MSDKTEHPPLPEKFAALGVRNSILRALAELKFTEPSEIQSLLIPRALAGIDILGQARTGTGKTAAFTIPIVQKAQRGLGSQAIILVPTRELCVQVKEEIRRIAQCTPIRVAAVYGGERIVAQMRELKSHPEIIVGTPGRVIDLLDRRLLSLSDIRFVVLDEVDRMLDIGFRDDIRNILTRIKGVRGAPPSRPQQQFDRQRDRVKAMEADLLKDHTGDEGGDRAIDQGSEALPEEDGGDGDHEPTVAAGHQTIFVSATISDEIERLARKYMREPVEKLIAPGADEKPTVENVEQYYFSVGEWDKYRLLRKLLQQEQPELAIVFCRTKHGADKLATHLKADGIACREIHGNLRQSKRESVMKNFRGGKFDVLVATDLASRGIDVADISHIINYDIPDDPEVYVHRVGRTARMGAQGKAFTFVRPDQGDELTRVENLINMIIKQGTVEGFEPSPPPARHGGGGHHDDRSSHHPALAAAIAAGPAKPPAPAAPPKQGMRLGAKIPLGRKRRR